MSWSSNAVLLLCAGIYAKPRFALQPGHDEHMLCGPHALEML
jgi:hypothetical protein